MDIVGKFKYENIEYVILIDDGSFKVGKILGDRITFNLTDSDKFVAREVVKSVAPSDKKVMITNVVIDGESYNVSYDTLKYYFIFEGINNDANVNKLNALYNNQSNVVFYNGTNNQLNNLFHRFVNVGKKTLLVALSSIILSGNVYAMEKDVEKQLVSNEVVADISIDNVNDSLNMLHDVEIMENTYSFDDERDADSVLKLAETIKNNTHLSDEEKRFILSNFDVVADNIDFIDVNGRLKVFEKLYTSYTLDEYQLNANAMGTFNRNENKMTFYKTESFEETDKAFVFHEFGHSLQSNSCNFNWITEGVNALCEEEYINGTSYEFEKNIVRALIEILGVDCVKSASFSGDDSIIMNALNEIIPDDGLAFRFMATVQSIHNDLYSMDKEKYIKSMNYAVDTLAMYYEAKYNRRLDDDLLMLYYLDNHKLASKLDIFFVHGASVYNDKFYFNIKDRENNDVIMTLGYDEITKKDVMSIEDALREGALIKTEDGSFVAQGLYYFDEAHEEVYRIEEKKYTEKEIVINEENRYLNNGMSR